MAMPTRTKAAGVEPVGPIPQARHKASPFAKVKTEKTLAEEALLDREMYGDNTPKVPGTDLWVGYSDASASVA